MDLLSLPDEMLTNVLKYGKRGRIRSLRKINQRIDQLARRANLTTKLPLKEFEISRKRIRIIVEKNEAEYLRIRYDYIDFELGETTDYIKTLEDWLYEVEIQKTLSIEDFFIDSAILDVLQKHKQSWRNVTGVSFKNISLILSPDAIQTFLSKSFSKLSDFRWNSNNAKTAKIMCNEKVFGNREWKVIEILSRCRSLFFIDDNFLMQFAPNCKRLSLDVRKTAITVNGAVNMYKNCINDLSFARIIHLGRISLGEVLIGEVEKLFNDIKQEIVVTSEWKYPIKEFKVYYKDWKAAVLHFFVEVETNQRYL